MPDLRPTNPVIAVLCADIHLSHKMPRCRADKNWYDSMAAVLGQIDDLRKEHNCKVLCAGDVFDRWNSPPELINFAIKHLPPMIAIPGQHDLPFHQYSEIKKSAYWTLVECGVIETVEPYGTFFLTAETEFKITGFPWGFDPCPAPPWDARCAPRMEIALVHRYIWKDQNSAYQNAPKENNVKNLGDFSGYNVACFGDNHKPFEAQVGDCSVFNPGALMRRSVDTKRCRVGLLLADGWIRSVEIEDKGEFIAQHETSVACAKIEDFIQKLQSEGGEILDFEECVKNGMDELHPQIQRMVVEALENARNGSKVHADTR